MSRYVCTAEAPYAERRAKPFGGRAAHPDAREVDCDCDCCAKYECPNCGEAFKAELPQ